MTKDSKSETNIHGDVDKLTQIGKVEGNVFVGTEPNFVHKIWKKLEPDLQDALSMAYNQARREGRKTIRTRYFFAALARLQPEPLPEFLSRIPQSVLPKPTNQQVTTESVILSENPELSGCVEDALKHLVPKATP